MRRLPGSQGRASYALHARVGRRAEENTGARMHADPGHKDGYGEEDGGWPDKGGGEALTGSQHDTVAARFLRAAPLALALALPALVAGLAAPPADLLLRGAAALAAAVGSVRGEAHAADAAAREVAELVAALVLVLLRERQRVLVALSIDRRDRGRDRVALDGAVGLLGVGV